MFWAHWEHQELRGKMSSQVAVDTVSSQQDGISFFWHSICVNHLIFPILILIVYLPFLLSRRKTMGKDWLFHVVELYALGHALGLSWDMIGPAFTASHDNGGLLGGIILGGITLVAISKILNDPKYVVKPMPKFKVISANYGIDGNEQDVTELVNRIISDGKLNIMVGNEWFGDPIPNREKRLRLMYVVDDKPLQKYYGEGNFIQLP